MYCPECGEMDNNKFILTSRGKDECTSCGWREGTCNNNSHDRASRLEKMRKLKPELPNGQMKLKAYDD